MKENDWVEILINRGGFSKGDTSRVVLIQGDYVDVQDSFGGKRGKKGRNGTQRFHKTEIKKLNE